MSMNAFAISQSVVLTSTTSNQTTTVPAGNSTMVAYNGGANVVYLKWAATVAVPTANAWTLGVYAIAPGTTQSIGNNPAGGTLAYIAETAGGELILSIGEGV